MKHQQKIVFQKKLRQTWAIWRLCQSRRLSKLYTKNSRCLPPRKFAHKAVGTTNDRAELVKISLSLGDPLQLPRQP